jgi:hypothetical protein
MSPACGGRGGGGGGGQRHWARQVGAVWVHTVGSPQRPMPMLHQARCRVRRFMKAMSPACGRRGGGGGGGGQRHWAWQVGAVRVCTVEAGRHVRGSEAT